MDENPGTELFLPMVKLSRFKDRVEVVRACQRLELARLEDSLTLTLTSFILAVPTRDIGVRAGWPFVFSVVLTDFETYEDVWVPVTKG